MIQWNLQKSTWLEASSSADDNALKAWDAENAKYSAYLATIPSHHQAIANVSLHDFAIQCVCPQGNDLTVVLVYPGKPAFAYVFEFQGSVVDGSVASKSEVLFTELHLSGDLLHFRLACEDAELTITARTVHYRHFREEWLKREM